MKGYGWFWEYGYGWLEFGIIETMKLFHKGSTDQQHVNSPNSITANLDDQMLT